MKKPTMEITDNRPRRTEDAIVDAAELLNYHDPDKDKIVHQRSEPDRH